MKTLIVYEKNSGNVSFTQSIGDVEDVEYNSIIADVPENKRPLRVENGTCILGDSYEIEEQKRKTKEKLDKEIEEANLKIQETENYIKDKKTETLLLQSFLIEKEYEKMILLQ